MLADEIFSPLLLTPLPASPPSPSPLQAHERILRDIKSLRSSQSGLLFKNLRAISAAVVEKGGVVAPHPLGF